MAGRKRKKGTRTASGQPPRATKDTGSSFLLRRKQELTGGADPALSTCVLDIMYARLRSGLRVRGVEPDSNFAITDTMRQAGHAYATARNIYFGRPVVSSRNYEEDSSGGGMESRLDRLGEGKLKRAEDDYRGVIQALTRSEKAILDDVCVYDRLPLWVKHLSGDTGIDPRVTGLVDLINGLRKAAKVLGL